MKQTTRVQLVIVALLISATGFSQFKEGFVHLKNGDTLFGFVKLREKNVVKFRLEKDGETSIYDEETLRGFHYSDFDREKTFEFLDMNGRGRIRLLERISEGKIALYGVPRDNLRGASGGTYGTSSGVVIGSQSTSSLKEFRAFYVLEDGGYEKVSARFNEEHLSFMPGCPQLENEYKEYRKSNYGVIEAFEYYNNNCGN